ncbi:DUF3817 domain-containing protein [Corynebacterium sp. P7003]|uniref:DUF3817 domain-containing protein n=1 Tax=Corynebacterium pygosceleis TaxID=2800406 RepID=A0ABT3WU01_9CORY|nr:DUF3817 domain-containing protein [Corynebacterium pygosceleis]MCX7445712.1 DUF3817 domain-containing protein [Corynebacterium pygosceleis]
MTAPTIDSNRPNGRQARIRTALRIFVVAAWVTGIWLLILTGRMILDYIFHVEMPSWANLIGQLHGLFYMCYLMATMNLGIKARWEPIRWLTTALAGTIPFFSFWMEQKRRRQVTTAFNL